MCAGFYHNPELVKKALDSSDPEKEIHAKGPDLIEVPGGLFRANYLLKEIN